MKKILSKIGCFIMTFALLAGCSSPSPSSEITSESVEEPTIQKTSFPFTMQEVIPDLIGEDTSWDKTESIFCNNDIAQFQDQQSKRLLIESQMDTIPSEVNELYVMRNQLQNYFAENGWSMTENETIEYSLQINSIDQEISNLMLDTALDSNVTGIFIYGIGDASMENESYQIAIRGIMQCEGVDENEARNIFSKINTQLRGNLGSNTQANHARHGDILYTCHTIPADEFIEMGFDFASDYEARRMCLRCV